MSRIVLIIIISALSVLVASAMIFCFIPLHKIEGFDKALEGVLLFSSITLGFYGACFSVLASIFNTKIVQELMEDQEYKREFLLVSGLSLVSGLLTVITTIVYQVMYHNDKVTDLALNITNTIWFAFTVFYLLQMLLFVLVIFMVFLGNGANKETNVNKGKVTNPDF